MADRSEPAVGVKSNLYLMLRTTLLRTVGFRATHRYWRSDWSDERNRRVFGAQTEPHEHEFRVQVTLEGDVDRKTGFLVDLASVDQVLGQVVDGLRDKNLNQAIPEVREGEMLPSTEELARWFWDRLQAEMPASARLVGVRVAESDELAAEVTLAGGEGPSSTHISSRGGSHV